MNPRQQNIPSPNTKGNVPPSIPFVPYNTMPMFYAPNQAPTPLFGPAFPPYHPVPPPMIIQPHPPQVMPPLPQPKNNPQDLKAIEDYIVSLLYKSKVSEEEPKKEDISPISSETQKPSENISNVPKSNEEQKDISTKQIRTNQNKSSTPRKNSTGQWKKKESVSPPTKSEEQTSDLAKSETQASVASTSPISIPLPAVRSSPAQTPTDVSLSQSPDVQPAPPPRKIHKYNSVVLAHPKDFERLSHDAYELYTSLLPPQSQLTKKHRLVVKLQKIAHELWPECNATMNLFGSSANTFGIVNSDVDVCLMIEDKAGNMQRIVNKLGEQLKKKQMKHVKTLPKARVPIVKFDDPRSGLSCDICINNALAIRNTQLIADYAKIDPRFHQMGFVIKYWAKQRQINEPYQGTLSSYAYLLLVLHFLQTRKPPILPCLQNMVGVDEAPYRVDIEGYNCYYYSKVDRLKDFAAANKETLGELLAAFFRQYACEFDWSNSVVSPRTGKYLSKSEKGWDSKSVEDLNTRDYFFFALEDPFEVTHNLGRLVDRPNLKVLKYEFGRAYRLICQNEPLSVILKEYESNENVQ